jgi:hypothetical protein
MDVPEVLDNPRCGGTRVMKSVLLASAVAFGLSPIAQAACEPGTRTVFTCLAAKGKRIQVCDAGKTIDYSFGKPGVPPEIVVRAPRGDASTSQWQGVGRYLSYSVKVPNGKTNYNVFWSADRLTEEHGIEAGVDVEVDGKRVATVKCVGEKHIVQAIEGIDLKPME